ncbi:MAG: cob(I)yrinic acid a,c-diamide adenosyltransferase [Phycisphaerae bacterium]|nr:cob(I)yrinic acid a,c-diamide adenosyltransferase [Phycisphaerae bacterium]
MKKKYPSTGDQGASKLVSGQMVGKDHINFEAVGTLDELNCTIGWVKCVCDDQEMKSRLDWMQKILFELGGYVSGWSSCVFPEEPIHRLETEIAAWQEKLPELRVFILPDGTELACRLHLARALCRKTERRISMLQTRTTRKIAETVPRFLNRLSDWFFEAARWSNFQSQVTETPWTKTE